MLLLLLLLAQPLFLLLLPFMPLPWAIHIHMQPTSTRQPVLQLLYQTACATAQSTRQPVLQPTSARQPLLLLLLLFLPGSLPGSTPTGEPGPAGSSSSSLILQPGPHAPPPDSSASDPDSDGLAAMVSSHCYVEESEDPAVASLREQVCPWQGPPPSHTHTHLPPTPHMNS